MKKGHVCQQVGFTLVETLVVAGVIMMIMVSIGGIVGGVFNSQRKNKTMEEISQSGGWIINELRKNVLNADGSGENGDEFICPIGVGTSMVITNIKDRIKTTLVCFDGGNEGYKIASISGKSVGTTTFLFQKDNDLVLNDCGNFITCTISPDTGRLSGVKFNFNLGANTNDSTVGTTKVFSVDLTVRN